MGKPAELDEDARETVRELAWKIYDYVDGDIARPQDTLKTMSRMDFPSDARLDFLLLAMAQEVMRLAALDNTISIASTGPYQICDERFVIISCAEFERLTGKSTK